MASAHTATKNPGKYLNVKTSLLTSHLGACSRRKFTVLHRSSPSVEHARLCEVLRADTSWWSHPGRIERQDSNADIGTPSGVSVAGQRVDVGDVTWSAANRAVAGSRERREGAV